MLNVLGEGENKPEPDKYLLLDQRIIEKTENVKLEVGTVVKHGDTNDLLCEITNDGEEQIIMNGGRGGQGNTHFKSATNQAPRFAQPGEELEEGWRILELKILADNYNW